VSSTPRRKQKKPRVLFPRPSLEGWEGLDLHKPVPGALTRAFPYWAVAGKAELFIYGSHGRKAWVWGKIRQGQRVPVKFEVRRDGCSRGNWYETPTGGFICNTHGFAVTRSSEPVEGIQPPRLDQPLPYTYLKVTRKPALQLARLPDADELEAAEKALKKGTELPGVVASTKTGAYFVALDREETTKAGKFYRTTLGNYVRAEGAERVEGPTMHGELLGSRDGLPLAFVFREQAPVHCPQKDGKLRRCYASGKPPTWNEVTVDGPSISAENVGYHSSLAVDGNGKVHIAHGRGITVTAGAVAKDQISKLRYTTNAGGSWSTTEPVQGSVGNHGGFASIAVGQGKVFITHTNNTDFAVNNGTIYFTSNASGAWSTTTFGSGAAQNGSWSALLLDSQGNAHVAYRDPVTQTLMHATNIGGSWALTSLASQGPSTNGWAAVAQQKSGTIHVTFESGNAKMQHVSFSACP
jgi:hypothetical protein